MIKISGGYLKGRSIGSPARGKGVRPTTQFKYLNAARTELANIPPKPWLSTDNGDYGKLNEIIYVELKLDLVFLEETTSYSTIVYPEKTQL